MENFLKTTKKHQKIPNFRQKEKFMINFISAIL